MSWQHLSISAIYQLLRTQFWPTFWTQFFWAFFVDHIIFGPNFLRPNYFLDPQTFCTNKFLYQRFVGLKFFWTRFFLDLNSFVQKSFGPKIFGPKFFYPKFFGLNFLGLISFNLSFFETLISLVLNFSTIFFLLFLDRNFLLSNHNFKSYWHWRPKSCTWYNASVNNRYSKLKANCW